VPSIPRLRCVPATAEKRGGSDPGRPVAAEGAGSGAVGTRRRALLALPAALPALRPCAPRAQELGAPRPVTLVAPFPAGSVTDNVARAVGQHLQEILGQPVVVDNRPGAQGTLAAAHVARSHPDGHTLLMGSSVMFVAKSLVRNLPYDPVESFQPVSGIGSTSLMLVVPAASPLRSLADLEARAARTDPPMSVGLGSPTAQVIFALFAAASGTRPQGVSYRGTPQAMADLAGGHIDAAVVDLFTGLGQARSGFVRPLAVSAAARSPLAPEVPTLQEAFPAAELALETIIAALAPARTPPAVVGRLDDAIRSALARPALQQRLAALATAALPLAAGDLDRRIRSDNARWETLIRQAGIEPE
jgi:tripartite-type tricarboxylate transporter receptor subunit TctC